MINLAQLWRFAMLRLHRPTHLTIRNRAGSVEHFYHFLLGFFLPLCAYLDGAPRHAPVLVRSCGPMDRIIRELDLPGLVIVDREAHAAMRAPSHANARPPKYAVLPSLDVVQRQPMVDIEGLRKGVSFAMRRWGERISGHMDAIVRSRPARPRVIIIERGRAHPFYLSGRAERRASGRERRYIANHAELVAALTLRFPGAQNLQLEDLALAEQIALFRTADVVIAQHGAALANIVWMRTGAQVIEVRPPQRWSAHFERLAGPLGLSYGSVGQDGNFGPVNADAVMALAEAGTSSIGVP